MRKSVRVAARAITESVQNGSRSSATKRARVVYANAAQSSSHVEQNGESASTLPVAKKLKTEQVDTGTTQAMTSASKSSLKHEPKTVTTEKDQLRPVTKKVKKTIKRKGRRVVSMGEGIKDIPTPTSVKVEKQAKRGTATKSTAKSDTVNSNLGLGQSKMLVGAHVSIAGGLYKAVHEAMEIGARSFGMFLRSQRKWESKPLEEKDAARFREACEKMEYKANSIVPHGIYLMNCGSPSEEILSKSRDVLVDELQRCEKLGIALYNFHPGSTCGKISVEECLKRIAESINLAHSKTKFVTTVVENMSCQGNTIGGKFKELHEIIDQVHDKSRIGICLDTCHAFAAGHNLATEQGFNEMMEEFESVVGIEYLKAVHLNDSKGELGCHLDRHENIGKGKIGLGGFKRLMQDSRFSGIPMILETPCSEGDTYVKEIKLLNSFVTQSDDCK